MNFLLSQNDIQDISQAMNDSIEKRIDELMKKRDALSEQLNMILKNKLEIHNK